MASCQIKYGFCSTLQKHPNTRPKMWQSRHMHHRTAASALRLEPVGDGDRSHIDGEIPPIAAIKLPSAETVLEVGRVEGNDIVIGIPTISARHAMLKVSASTVTVTDTGSTNGTFIDGEQLPAMESVLLPVSSVVTFGDPSLASFRLIEDDA